MEDARQQVGQPPVVRELFRAVRAEMHRRSAMVLHQGLMYLFHVLWELVRAGQVRTSMPWDHWPSAMEPARLLAAAPPSIQAVMSSLPDDVRQHRLLWGRLAMAAVLCLTKGAYFPPAMFPSASHVRFLLILALQSMRHAQDTPPCWADAASESIMENATLLLNVANVELESLEGISDESFRCYDLQALQRFFQFID